VIGTCFDLSWALGMSHRTFFGGESRPSGRRLAPPPLISCPTSESPTPCVVLGGTAWAGTPPRLQERCPPPPRDRPCPPPIKRAAVGQQKKGTQAASNATSERERTTGNPCCMNEFARPFAPPPPPLLPCRSSSFHPPRERGGLLLGASAHMTLTTDLTNVWFRAGPSCRPKFCSHHVGHKRTGSAP
jgi:hypothetical protein